MKPFTLAQFTRYLRSEVDAAGGVRSLGRALRISPMRISEVLTGTVPGDTLLKALGFRRCTKLLYERAK